MARQAKGSAERLRTQGNFAVPARASQGRRQGRPARCRARRRYNAPDVSSWPCLRTLRGRVIALGMASATLMGACGTPPPEPIRKEVVIWKQLGSWSGRGNAQTESFVGLTGSLRLRWRTTLEDPKGQGRFKLILQSAISGRALQEPVDEEGPGEGTAYAADDPRVFHILVESANLDWSFTVEEAAFGTASP
jgi:hypothetical protein